ncbi:MAG: OmpA family protein, partial [Pseudomonadota bacterium]
MDSLPTGSTLFKTIRQAARADLEAGNETTRVPLLVIPFDLRSTELTEDALPALATIAELMTEPGLDEATLRIEGHTDAIGSNAANFTVSLTRAIEVRDALATLFAVDPERVQIEGLGEGRLLARLDPTANRQRRVEITLVVESAAFSPPTKRIPPDGLSTMPFDGAAQSAIVALGTPFEGAFGQTVDFWVAAEWDDDAVFVQEPLIYAFVGPNGVRQSVHITEERNALAYYDGDLAAFDYTRIPFDFSDGSLRHVTVGTYDGETVIAVDGRVIGLIPRGVAPVAGDQLIIGGSTEGTTGFAGRIGGLRLWNAILLPDDLRELPAHTGNPGPESVIYDNLLAMMDVDGDRAILREIEPVIPIPDGAWTTFGSDHVEIHNDLEFHDGGAAELYSHHLKDHAERDATENTRTFSTYPLYLLQTDLPAIRTEPHLVGDASAGERFTISQPTGWTIARIEARVAPDGINALRLITTDGDREHTGSWLGEIDSSVDVLQSVTFEADDDILGIEGFARDRIQELSFITVSGVKGPLGLSPEKRPSGARPFRRMVPAGATFRGFESITNPVM